PSVARWNAAFMRQKRCQKKLSCTPGTSHFEKLRAPGNKLQIPNSKLQRSPRSQTPNTKLQTPEKLQAPSSKRGPRFGGWNWGFRGCLELGFWCFDSGISLQFGVWCKCGVSLSGRPKWEIRCGIGSFQNWTVATV